MAFLIAAAGPVASAGSAVGQHAETAVAALRGAAVSAGMTGLTTRRTVRNPFGTKTILVSQSSTGELTLNESESYTPDVSGGGRFVVFESDAPNLVSDDTNLSPDVFLRDVVARTTTRINLTFAGQQSSAGLQRPGLRFFSGMGDPSISADGRYVAFVSFATDMDPADTNARPDVYLYDRVLNSTRVLTVDPRTGEAVGGRRASLSLDGDHLVFVTKSGLDVNDDNNHKDIYLLTISSGQYTWVSVGPGGRAVGLGRPALSSVDAHGDAVLFGSRASDFVPRDTNGQQDVFVRDLAAATTTRVSLSSAGRQLDAPSFVGHISGNGQVVTFETQSNRVVPADDNHLGDVFARNLTTDRTRIVSVGQNEEPGNEHSTSRCCHSGIESSGDLSRDGHLITFFSTSTTFMIPHNCGGIMGGHSSYVRDMRAGTTKAFGITIDGECALNTVAGASISPDGKYAAFPSWAFSLTSRRRPLGTPALDIYVRH